MCQSFILRRFHMQCSSESLATISCRSLLLEERVIRVALLRRAGAVERGSVVLIQRPAISQSLNQIWV